MRLMGCYLICSSFASACLAHNDNGVIDDCFHGCFVYLAILCVFVSSCFDCAVLTPEKDLQPRRLRRCSSKSHRQLNILKWTLHVQNFCVILSCESCAHTQKWFHMQSADESPTKRKRHNQMPSAALSDASPASPEPDERDGCESKRAKAAVERTTGKKLIPIHRGRGRPPNSRPPAPDNRKNAFHWRCTKVAVEWKWI